MAFKDESIVDCGSFRANSENLTKVSFSTLGRERSRVEPGGEAAGRQHQHREGEQEAQDADGGAQGQAQEDVGRQVVLG